MGLLNLFHDKTGYVFARGKSSETLDANITTYDWVGAQTIDSIARIDRMLSNLDAGGYAAADTAVQRDKNEAARQCIETSKFSRDEFKTWGLDEDSVWMKTRTACFKETIAREKLLAQSADRILNALKDKKAILAWPAALVPDIKLLTKWCDEVAGAVGELKTYLVDKPKTQRGTNEWAAMVDLTTVETEIVKLRDHMFQWTQDSESLAVQAGKIDASTFGPDGKSTPFKALLEQTDAHRKEVKKSMEDRSKVTSLMSKIRKFKEAIDELAIAKPIFAKLKEEVATMITMNRNSPLKSAKVLSSHGKFRCQKALEKAVALTVTGDPALDCAGVKRCIQELKEAQRAAKEPYGGYS